MIIGTGTVTTATPIETDIPTPLSSNYKFQIDVTGGNSVAIATKVKGQSASNTQISGVSGETVILEMTDIESITLTATGGDVPYVISTWKEV